MMAHFETKLTSDVLFEGRVVRLTKDTVQLENGKTSTREVVHHNGGAAVIAMTDDHEIYLVRQYRYALGEELLEVPAGKLEKGEDPFVAAKRELSEETGLSAEDYVDLGYIIPTCGYCTEKIYLYAAKGLTQDAQHLDADEFVSTVKMPRAEAVQKVMLNEIRDAKTAVAVLKLEALCRAGLF